MHCSCFIEGKNNTLRKLKTKTTWPFKEIKSNNSNLSRCGHVSLFRKGQMF